MLADSLRVRALDRALIRLISKPSHTRIIGGALHAGLFSTNCPDTYLCSTLAIRVWYGMPSASARA